METLVVLFPRRRNLSHGYAFPESHFSTFWSASRKDMFSSSAMRFLPWVRWLLWCIGGLTTAGAALAQPVEVVPVRDPAWTQTLNGAWKFRYVAGPAVESDGAFAHPDFDDQAWASLAVPAHWELHGFAEPKYASVQEGVGYYRRSFSVPPAWKEQRVMLHFEGVLYGCEVWINGKNVGQWTSSYNPTTFDVTDALKPTGDNLVAVRVTTRPKGWDFDTNDCWALSGIFRDVTLFTVPATHFQRTSARTTLDSQGRAHLQVAAWLAGTTEGAKIHGRLREAASGGNAQEFELPLNADHGEVTFEVQKPTLWTAETPFLYTLELTVERTGQRAETLVEKIGLRQVTIEDGVLRLNGRPIKLRGVDHHDIWPEEGRVATEALMRRDLELIKAANCNFIRTSHYPPHPRFIELCDELGVYVMDEVPFGFGDQHLKDPTYQDNLLTRARATILRDENRPSVIVWSVGNENPNTPLTFATGKRVKELDPSRPICYPQVGTYFAKSFEELPDWVDIYAPHYPNVATVRDYATRLKRPVIFTEYAHALGLATDRIQEEWAIMQTSPHLAGGAVWMFQDQGILRTSPKPVGEFGTNPYVWLDEHRYYDTNKLDGMDGIVYSDRTPQVDYWEVRKVYSPVQISAAGTPSTVQSELSLEVQNRFDFRALTGINLEWALRRNREIVASGKEPLHAKANTTESVKLAWSLEKRTPSDFFDVSLRCLDEAGHAFYEKVIRLGSDSSPSDRTTVLLDGAVSTAPRLEETADLLRVVHPTVTAELDRHTGELVLRDPTGHLIARGPLPHTGRTRLTLTEGLRAKRDSIWLGATLSHPAKLETRAIPSAEGITFQVRGEYSRNDTPEQRLSGGFTALVRPNGAIDITYDFAPLQAQGSMIEAGVSFIAAPTDTEFRWIGAGPYAGYPGKDALNEFGIFHLNRDDLAFGGNRRATDVAVLSAPAGVGFAILSPSGDIAVESSPDGVILSHNALVAGRGNKGVQAETLLLAAEIKQISGHFSLIPLGPTWPATLTRWMGPQDESAPLFHPFYQSYDQ